MIGYFDVRNGCAGDMIAGALAGCVNIREIKKILNDIDLPSPYSIEIRQVKKDADYFHDIEANQFIVKVKGREKARSYKEIVSIFEKSRLACHIKEKILNIFYILAVAEGTIHKKPLEKLHFHAVGQTDALVEIAFSVIALDLLGIKKVFASPVGISCAAPATMEIARGIPVKICNIPFEITTPTGISIIKGITDSYDNTPLFFIKQYCYGTGTIVMADFPNLLQFSYGSDMQYGTEKIGILETSIDDMNPVIFDHLMDVLYAAGVLEVSFFTGITKKSRPIFLIRILCRPHQRGEISGIIFRETTTLGIRYREEERIALKRKLQKIKTEYGDVDIKIGYLSGQPVNVMPEYEQCKTIAMKKKIPLKKVIEEILKISLKEKY